MLPKLEHFPVNWVDGMKIARKHFKDFEQYVSDHLRDAVATGLNSVNYGLLPSSAPDFNLLIIPEQNHHVRVQLFTCRALTGAGCRIEIINEQLSVTTNLADLRDKYNLPHDRELEFIVVVSVNLFVRQPYGQPAHDEPFLRPPFSLPTYQLSIEPSHLYNAQTGPGGDVAFPSAEFESHSLIVGKLVFSGNELREDKSYIPACTSVNSHVALADWANRMAKLLTEVQGHAIEIVRLVCKKRGAEEVLQEARPLAELIRQWAEQLADQLDAPLNQLRFTGRQLPPVYLIEAITLATKRFQTTLACLNHPEANYGLTQMGEEKVLSYFKDWTGIAPVTIKQAVDEVVNYVYHHSNIRPHLEVISSCWDLIFTIVQQLVQLDYIGEEKDEWHVRRRSTVTDRSNLPRESSVATPASEYVDYQISRKH